MIILLISIAFVLVVTIVLYYKCKTIKPKNKVHFYVARDSDGSLWLFIGKPFRKANEFNTSMPDCYIRLSTPRIFKYFGLNKNDYANLKWEDEPLEVFVNMKD